MHMTRYERWLMECLEQQETEMDIRIHPTGRKIMEQKVYTCASCNKKIKGNPIKKNDLYYHDYH